MLDYDLVTAKAAYRILTPDQLPAFLELVESYHAESRSERPDGRQKTLTTVRELTRHKRAGSLFVIERGKDLVGYCVVINHWSNALGGNVLCLDELYVCPEHRGLGIATDFVELLAKIAPADSVALELRPYASNRKAASLCKRLRFREPGIKAVVREIGER